MFYLNNSISVSEATLQEIATHWTPERSGTIVLWVPELRAVTFCLFCSHFTSKINFDLADFEFLTPAAMARRSKQISK